MGLADITRKAVLAAIEEHDRDGEEAFLKKYGFRRAQSYWLEHGKQLYSSKAIIGAAHRYVGANSQPLIASEFTGGKATVEAKLRSLGFTVRVDRDGEHTSEGLIEGQIYTRDRLKAEFGITDATIGNGVFQPRGTSSVWLFVTEEKPKDRIQYKDRLHGDTLHMQGQKAGRTDHLIIEHSARGLELLVFHRRTVREYPGAGFRYIGVFAYQEHSGAKPASFILNLSFANGGPDAENDPGFDPANIQDARKRIARSIAERRGQGAFRNKLLAAYDGACAITGCEVLDVLEAAHIYPYRGDETNHLSNGLLLRADLHTLFDCGLISVQPKSKKVVVAKRLIGTEYGELAGKRLRKPSSMAAEPNLKALQLHHKERVP